MSARLNLYMPLVAVACFFVFFPASRADAATIRVPSEQPTIQAGIDASVNGDTVLVADGTYTGSGNKNLDYEGKAIVVMSENLADVTVIDCEDSGRGFYFHSGESSDSKLEGFTIINGDSGYGGGIYCCDSSSPTISHCMVSHCTADYAGGIYMHDSSPTITN